MFRGAPSKGPRWPRRARTAILAAPSGSCSMRAFPALLAAAALLLPVASRAEAPPVIVGVTGGVHVPSGSLPVGGGGGARVSVGIGRQLFLGVLGGASLHPGSDRTVALTHLGALAEWRLDTTRLVPLVSVSVGGLQASAPGASPERYGAFSVGLGLEWWPKAPLTGLCLGAEVRYLGLLPDVASLTPIVTTVALRVGWGF